MKNQIDSDQITFEKPPLEFFLKEYNEILANILFDNKEKIKFIASSTLNRHESQTHLYEKVEKYRQISAFLHEGQSQVRLVGEDAFLFDILQDEFGSRVKIDRAPISIPFKQVLLFFKLWIFQFLKSIVIFLIGRIKDYRSSQFSAVIRTYFDHRCVRSDGCIREEYFGPFAEDLGREMRLLVVFKILSNKDFLLYLKAKPANFFEKTTLESLVGIKAICKVYFSFLKNRLVLQKKHYYRGLNITRLIQKSMDEDFFKVNDLAAHLELEAAIKIFDFNLDYVFYPFENQAWEKMYPFVKRKRGEKTKIIGFQHTGISFKLLNYFPTEIEKTLPYFPDKILTVGGILKIILDKYGFYPCPIVEGAALRHQKHVKNGGFSFIEPDLKNYKSIVYAFSYDKSKYKKIISTLISCFQSETVRVFLKMHPLYSENKVIKEFEIKLPSNFILAQSFAWRELYKSVDIAFYDDNSIAIEGLINGVKTFQFDVGEPIYSCERLFDFYLWDFHADEKKLELIRGKLENESFDKSWDQEYIENYVRNYFVPYNRKKHFHVFL